MKSFFLLLFITGSILNGQAQDIWVDCVIGKPYMADFEAKEAVAKEWGINYQSKFMGCQRTKAMERKAKKQAKINQKG